MARGKVLWTGLEGAYTPPAHISLAMEIGHVAIRRPRCHWEAGKCGPALCPEGRGNDLGE